MTKLFHQLYVFIEVSIREYNMKNFFAFVLILTGILSAQQIGDPDFNPEIKNPAYKPNSGPVILIDEAHNNFHTMTGRYKPFADLIAKDGYIVKPNTIEFNLSALKDARILVISNPLNKWNIEDWSLPTPSAFIESEMRDVEEWVKNGGSLFLISDHMPFPGASGELAKLFGFEMSNGFARDTLSRGGPDLFTRNDKTLGDNFITNGNDNKQKVDSIYTFTGQAFKVPKDAQPVLILNKNFVSLVPDTAWVFN
ncbi:MAG: hypothetical protein C0412_12745, partial [Flavobacterium sp.]|nr:hypothetical protein [Flavobacterium sp.]